MISFVASSLDSVVVLSVQSVSGLGCGAGSVGKVWALDGLGGRWDSVASVFRISVSSSSLARVALKKSGRLGRDLKSSIVSFDETVAESAVGVVADAVGLRDSVKSWGSSFTVENCHISVASSLDEPVESGGWELRCSS